MATHGLQCVTGRRVMVRLLGKTKDTNWSSDNSDIRPEGILEYVYLCRFQAQMSIDNDL